MLKSLVSVMIGLIIAMSSFALLAQPVAPAPVAPEAATVAPAPTPNPDDLGGILSAIVDAFKAKNWGILAGLVIMLVVWGVKKFIPKIPTNYLPWISAALGMLAAMATDLISGGTWYVVLFNGLLVGAAASGLWSLVGKQIFGAHAEPAAPATPAAPGNG